MDASELELGSVFRLLPPSITEPNRVLLVDNDVVMYDTWRSHLGNWAVADPAGAQRGAWTYYVTLVATVLEKATFVRMEPLSPTEVALHRPDLPFAIGQDSTASWS